MPSQIVPLLDHRFYTKGKERLRLSLRYLYRPSFALPDPFK